MSLQEWDDEWSFTIVYQLGAPPTPPAPPEEETKIPAWVWILGAVGGAFLLLSRRGEE